MAATIPGSAQEMGWTPAPCPPPTRGQTFRREDSCQTNPIRPNRQAGRVAREQKRAKRTQFPAGPGGTRPQGRRAKGKCAKRTQFRGRGAWDAWQMCKTNPIWAERPRMGAGGARRPGRAKDAKRTQFPARPEGRGTRANRAKRTQFRRADRPGPGAGGTDKANLPPAGYPTIPLFHHSSSPIPCLSCETNPIGGSPAGVQGPIVQNEPNSGQSAGSDPGRSCQTKPIGGVSSVRFEVSTKWSMGNELRRMGQAEAMDGSGIRHRGAAPCRRMRMTKQLRLRGGFGSIGQW